MRSNLFYIIVVLFATAQAVIVRSLGPEITAEKDPNRFKPCKWPLSVSPHTTVSLTAFIFFF